MNPWGMFGIFLLAVFCGAVIGVMCLTLVVLYLYAKDMKKKHGGDPYDPRA